MDIGLRGTLEKEGNAVGVGEVGMIGDHEGDVLTVVDGVCAVAGNLDKGLVQIY